jgi:hypothetical protein
MNSRRWLLSRRTMLRGLGVAIALPLLDAMVPPPLLGSEPKVVPRKVPVRFAGIYMPNGVNPEHWTPKAVGPLVELPQILAPLEKVKGEVTIISGLQHKLSFLSDPHHGKCAAFLTGTTVKKTTGADISSGGISADQLAAQHLGQFTRLPSIELSTEHPSSYIDTLQQITCLYGCHISWSSPTTPMARETDPRQAFDRLFRGQGGASGDATAKRATALTPWDDRSIPDFVMDDSASLKGKLGAADTRKLDEYLTSVRDVERRIQGEIKHASEPRHIAAAAFNALPALEDRAHKFNGSDRKTAHPDLCRLMIDLIVLAFWTDTTRIATFMFGNEVTGQNFSFIDGVNGGHHDISHHENKPEKLEMYKKIGIWHIQQMAYMFESMKAIKEGPDTLLDNSMVLFGSGIRDGNSHDAHDLPILLGGRGGRTIAACRHIACKPETPMANLLGDILARLGLQVERFADSTGPIKELAGG